MQALWGTCRLASNESNTVTTVTADVELLAAPHAAKLLVWRKGVRYDRIWN